MSSKRLILRHGSEMDYLTEADGVRDCRTRQEINTSSVLELDIRPDNPKYWYFERPDMTAEANGRVYCLHGEDCIETSREGETPETHVVLKELWYKLGKRYITAYNCVVGEESEYDHIDRHMVVLLGNSSSPLYINGAAHAATSPVGTAQYLVEVLLHGTGWSLDARYAGFWPGGAFDLETDKKSVLENLELVQQMFGGMLLWDSINRRVALVDEDKYLQDDGFDVRYTHNLLGISRAVNHDIVNRLYPYGNDDLNIAGVNGGRECLDDFSYTGEVHEGILKHSDIYNQDNLLAWGKRELKKLARPRYTYTVDFLDYDAEGAANMAQGVPGPVLGHMARVEDAEVTRGHVTLRVIGLERNVFRPLDCEVTVGDVTGTWPQTVKDLLVAESKVTNNITNSNNISGTIVRGSTPALDKAEIRWGDNLNNTASGIYSHVEKTYETKTDAAHTYGVLSTTITQTAEEIRTEARHTYETKTAAATTKAELTTTISQTAEQIRLEAKATYETQEAARTTKTALESSITQTASSIRAEVKATYETKTDASTTKRSLESSITQTASTIRSEVQATYTTKTEHSETTRRLESSVTQTAAKLESRVYGDINRIDGTMGSMDSRITQNAGRVNVLVREDGAVRAQVLVEAINGGSIKISASKVNLSGYVTITNLKNGQTEIDGSCIKTGTIVARHISNVFTDTFTLRCGYLYIQGKQVRIVNGYLRA